MRRLVILTLLLILPLQFAWAAVLGIHGHTGNTQALSGPHMHPHHHGMEASADPAPDAASESDGEHGADEHPDHTHPVFTSLLAESGLPQTVSLPGGPILHLSAVFLSRIPPLPDRPPHAHA
ncbi:MAG: hypothetical protein B7Y26_00970 [Hydrogenophilales bacterium 16-64-46]|nr:MAG: hypothetical protein B7Z32_09145 [Hydrogenophilales bacterium 12-64-13]OYZ07194.1 MAG: hypothetical protein B7Y26_00970 [Hydrogenophilales bacterium 16-64-46]OZA37338.1 MAG: hypothetical protein B7X87_11515 [Hydrogenophilales bacterium 17-64-34]HQT00645.1 hypothetical protein [Thiobacillus sp.]